MSSRDEAQNLQLAFSLHRNGKFAEAAKLYRKVIKSNPRQPHALHSLGIIEAANGNNADAARLMARSLSIQTTNLQFMQNYATVLCQLKQYETARAVCLKGLETDRSNVYLLYVLAGVLLKQNRLRDSLLKFDELLSHEPNHVAAITERSSVLLTLKQYDDARAGIEQAIAIDPYYAEAHLNRGILYVQLGHHKDAIASFDQALRLNPALGNAWLGYGNVLFELKRFDEALVAYGKAETLKSDLDQVSIGRGNALYELQRYHEAAAAYDIAQALSPGLAEAWVGRGNVLRELKQYDEALAAYDKALASRAETAEAWLGRGNVLMELLRYEEALAACDAALTFKAGFAEAWLARGNSLLGLKRLDEALLAYDKAAGLTEAWVGRGNVFYELERYPEAAAAYDKALALKPGLAEAWVNRGNVLREFKQYDEAFAAYDRALQLKPHAPGVEGTRLQAKLQVCNWTDFAAERARLISALKQDRITRPFDLLSISTSPGDQYRCARLFSERNWPQAGGQSASWKQPAHDRIRVAYMSADFRQHPVANLVVGVFEEHDRSQFEVTGISIGPDDGSEMRRRLEACFGHFVEARSLTDDQVANLLEKSEVDILVDLMGFTKGARTGIIARRPAPIQVNYLGYPGTMGSQHIDYIIADRVVIPGDRREFFSEKIAYLPFTYQPNSRGQRGDGIVSRADAGLPPDGFVFCCFNNSFKILPDIFDVWMRILHAVEGSVLWLLEDNEMASANLRNEAVARGVAAERLIATRLPQTAHLARHRMRRSVYRHVAL